MLGQFSMQQFDTGLDRSRPLFHSNNSNRFSSDLDPNSKSRNSDYLTATT